MGMSSSQARLLTLTARMHDIEYKAQRIEAQKLQMANESRRVYEDYLNALDARKIQYKTMNDNGSITFIDANLNRLENGAVPGWDDDLTSNKTFLLINHDTNELYLTPAFAEEYHFEDGQELGYDGTLDDYLTDNNAATDIIDIYGPDYDNPIAWAPVTNGRVEPYVAGNEGTTVWSIDGDITPAVVPAPGEYTLSESLSEIITTTTNPTSTPAQNLSFNAVQGGLNVSSPTTVINGSSVNLPTSYQTITGTTYTFKNFEGKTFEEIINECYSAAGDTPQSDATNLYMGKAGYAYYVAGDEDTLLDRLMGFSQDYRISGTNSFMFNGFGELGIYDNTNSGYNEAASQYFYANYVQQRIDTSITATTITKDTTLNQLMNSNLSLTEVGSTGYKRTNMPILTVNNVPYDYSALGITQEAFGNLSLEHYVNRVASITGDNTLRIDDSSGLKILSDKNDVNLKFISGSTHQSSTTNQTDVNINLDSLAKNIFLALAISTNMSADDYQSAFSNHSIDSIKHSLTNSNDNASLACMYDDLNRAFMTNDPHKYPTFIII